MMMVQKKEKKRKLMQIKQTQRTGCLSLYPLNGKTNALKVFLSQQIIYWVFGLMRIDFASQPSDVMTSFSKSSHICMFILLCSSKVRYVHMEIMAYISILYIGTIRPIKRDMYFCNYSSLNSSLICILYI